MRCQGGERVSVETGYNNTHTIRSQGMFSIDNAKAFKVSKALREKWEEMTDRNDHAGVILEKVVFIKKGLEKIKSPLIVEARRHEGFCETAVETRDTFGLLYNHAYLRMACALVAEEAGEEVANEILNA